MTDFKTFVLLAVLVYNIETANILCTVAIPGSHFFVTKNIAELLVNRGHNVTFVSATLETRVKMHPDIHYITPTRKGIGYTRLEDYFDSMDQVLNKRYQNYFFMFDFLSDSKMQMRISRYCQAQKSSLGKKSLYDT